MWLACKGGRAFYFGATEEVPDEWAGPVYRRLTALSHLILRRRRICGFTDDRVV
jgi:hypothetical protein